MMTGRRVPGSRRRHDTLARTAPPDVPQQGLACTDRPAAVELKTVSKMDRDNGDPTNSAALLACARWLEECLDALPERESGQDWKESVRRNQQRRDAEFAIAAALQRRGGSRTTVTTSPGVGTTIRILGLRASSPDGFEAACRDWIEKARHRDHGKALRFGSEPL